MQYQTKRQKITNYVNQVIEALKTSEKTGILSAIVANGSISLGVKEAEILDVIETFERAKLVEIQDDTLLV